MIWADENNSKAIQQIEIVGQSKNLVIMVMLQMQANSFRKNWRNEIKISKGRVTVLWKMENYEVTSVKLKNIQQNKLKSATKIRLKQHKG